MLKALEAAWTISKFFAWHEGQGNRFELVDGSPVQMRAGESNAHNDIVINVLAALRSALRGGPCRPFNGDGAVETKPGQIRRPDAGVECGPRDPNAFKAENPLVIAEVMSPTTRDFDTYGKVEEYKQIASLRRILLIEPNWAEVLMWARAEAGDWEESSVLGIDSAINMPEIGIALPLSEIYAGIVFPTELRLVAGR